MIKKDKNGNEIWLHKDSITYEEINFNEYKKAWDYPKAWDFPKITENNISYNYKELNGKNLIISVKEDDNTICVFGTDETTGITYLLTIVE
jgi:hypothetical protein